MFANRFVASFSTIPHGLRELLHQLLYWWNAFQGIGVGRERPSNMVRGVA